MFRRRTSLKNSKTKKNSFNRAAQNMVNHLSTNTFINAEDHSHYDKELFRFCKDLLLQINSKGFITENSQIGSSNPGFEERAYLCGFIRKEYSKRFIKFINEKCNNKMAIMIKSPITKATKKIIVTYDAGEPFSVFTTNLEENVIKQMYRDNNISRRQADYILIIDNEFGRIANDYQGLFVDVIDALNYLHSNNRTRRSWFQLWN
jgi:hypothetical protein